MTCEDWIMVVENSDAHAHICARALSQVGLEHPVHVETDAESALRRLFAAAAEDRLPFLILLSLSLPALDGLDALRLLADEGIIPRTTVVVTSRIADRTLPERCARLGAAAYLVEAPTDDEWIRQLRTLPAVAQRITPP
ncbi:MAG: response regulator [Phycisphaerales bacterium]|nr:response regulator [Phycisphaerales bacterium]